MFGALDVQYKAKDRVYRAVMVKIKNTAAF